MGLFSTFSFHGTKTITTGEGGMFVTNNKDFYEKVLMLSNHGRSRHQTKQFWPEEAGFKYKMSNISAAIGVAQIERIEELINKKREIFKNYQELLANYSVSLNPEPENTSNGYWMPTFICNGENKDLFNRDSAITHLKKNNIDARVIFWPLNTLNIPHIASNNLKYSSSIHLKGLNLPSPFDIEFEQQALIVKVLHKFIL